jgi:serine/threonine protein kinase
MMAINPNTILNKRYTIESVLGHGGMSSVYRALDVNIGVPVAVKENLVLTEDYSKQFQREATILATLRHPNLPRVSDYFFIPAQGQYLVMDFIEGEDLRERIERIEQLPPLEVILIGSAICDALIYLHQRTPPVIHRDIKPGNIKITPEGHVVLVDFGLVKLLEGNQQTTTGARAMTPGYSPPEQYGTGHTDERSDIYSLGATLYAALTGVIPEDGLSRLTGKTKLTPLKKKRHDVPSELAYVIEKALAIEPEKRYQNAEDFRKALLKAGNLTTAPVDAGLVSPPPEEIIDQSIIHTGISQPVINIAVDSGLYLPQNSFFSNLPMKWIISSVAILLIIVLGLQFNFIQRFFNNQVPPATTPAVTTSKANLPAANLPSTTKTSSLEPVIPFTETKLTKTPSTITTPNGGGSGKIAFASNRNNDVMQLWLMNSDGSNEKQLTNIPDGACQPDWSPDGTKLAFISPCVNKREVYDGSKIFTMDLSDDNAITPLPLPTNPLGDFDPTWSPDGKKIAFASLRPGTDPETKEQLIHIFIYNFDTGQMKEITNERWKDRHPDWSSDGNQLAFVRKVATNEIWIIDLTTQYAVRFASSNNAYNTYPIWSKDDNMIFFTQQSSDRGLPYFVGKLIQDIDSSVEFRIPPSGQPPIIPAAQQNLSPDGEWFIYESWPDGENHDIYIATINGANQTRLTENDSFDFGPVWQPSN